MLSRYQNLRHVRNVTYDADGSVTIDEELKARINTWVDVIAAARENSRRSSTCDDTKAYGLVLIKTFLRDYVAPLRFFESRWKACVDGNHVSLLRIMKDIVEFIDAREETVHRLTTLTDVGKEGTARKLKKATAGVSKYMLSLFNLDEHVKWTNYNTPMQMLNHRVDSATTVGELADVVRDSTFLSNAGMIAKQGGEREQRGGRLRRRRCRRSPRQHEGGGQPLMTQAQSDGLGHMARGLALVGNLVADTTILFGKYENGVRPRHRCRAFMRILAQLGIASLLILCAGSIAAIATGFGVAAASVICPVANVVNVMATIVMNKARTGDKEDLKMQVDERNFMHEHALSQPFFVLFIVAMHQSTMLEILRNAGSLPDDEYRSVKAGGRGHHPVWSNIIKSLLLGSASVSSIVLLIELTMDCDHAAADITPVQLVEKYSLLKGEINVIEMLMPDSEADDKELLHVYLKEADRAIEALTWLDGSEWRRVMGERERAAGVDASEVQQRQQQQRWPPAGTDNNNYYVPSDTVSASAGDSKGGGSSRRCRRGGTRSGRGGRGSQRAAAA